MFSNEVIYHKLFLIRRFEETVLENFSRGVFTGTTHTYLGQEANAVGVLSNIQSNDIVFSNHRCHGHFLAYGGDPRALFAELMGKSTGVSSGRGGSQHLHWKNFYSNGVQGGIVPVATGMALAEKVKKTNSITITFLGDGTLGQGVIYEAFNMASLWRAPILYVLENNRIAQTTPISLAFSGNILSRFTAFGIPGEQLESSNVLEIFPVAKELIEQVRTEQAPRALVLHTQRFGPHSKGDDTRSADQIQNLWEKSDPVRLMARYFTQDQRISLEAEVESQVSRAYNLALADPFPEADSLFDEPIR